MAGTLTFPDLKGPFPAVILISGMGLFVATVLKKVGNSDYETVELPGLNHRFQHCVTGLLAQLATIDETIVPEVL